MRHVKPMNKNVKLLLTCHFFSSNYKCSQERFSLKKRKSRGKAQISVIRFLQRMCRTYLANLLLVVCKLKLLEFMSRYSLNNTWKKDPLFFANMWTILTDLHMRAETSVSEQKCNTWTLWPAGRKPLYYVSALVWMR